MRKKFKVTRTLRKKIKALAEKVGCPLNWKRSCGIQWDGVDTACKGEDASNIIHDIAHYALATKRERKLLDFGLGPSPSTHVLNSNYDLIYRDAKKRDSFKVKGRSDSAIEAKASALGIYWEKQMGLPWEDTAAYHFWRGKEYEDLKEKWKELSYYTRKYK